jgi:hypothetical protein
MESRSVKMACRMYVTEWQSSVYSGIYMGDF